MKRTNLTSAVAIAMAVALMSACGGGDDDTAGSPTAFSVSPTELSWSTSGGSACFSGPAGIVFVNGGAAPYRLQNTSPDVVVLSTDQVNDRGGSFSVIYTGACTSDDGVGVNVLDKLNNLVTVKFINKIASAS